MLYPSENRVDLKEQSALSLAFLGDGVLELLTRQRLVQTTRLPIVRLHSETVRLVSAKGQAKAARSLLAVLTPEEEGVFRRGKNSSKSSVAKHASAQEYSTSTALEALFGYLYLAGRDARIQELFDLLWAAIFEIEAGEDQPPEA